MPFIRRHLFPRMGGRIRGFDDLELFFGLAQRNRGRKTTYFDAFRGLGKPGAMSILHRRLCKAALSQSSLVAEQPCRRATLALRKGPAPSPASARPFASGGRSA